MADNSADDRGEDGREKASLNDSVLVGLIGRGIGPSRSPLMHEREGLRQGFNYVYKRLDFDVMGLSDSALPEILACCRRMGFSGVNVTLPFKQAVVPHLDRLSDTARRINAVNTVRFDGTGMTGHNTDCWGFAESFRQGLPGVACKGVMLVGAGGAGRAVLHALLDLGVEQIWVLDQDPDTARSAVEAASHAGSRVRAASLDKLAEVLPAADGVVNATPLGMARYPGTSIPTALLSARQWVADIVYFPERTDLIERSSALGCATLPGGGMAVYQAVRAFELFTGRQADAGMMNCYRLADQPS